MTRVRGLLALILLAIVLAAGARADDARQPVRHHLTLYGKQIPLPAGDWLVAGSAPTLVDIAGRPLPATAASLVLFRVEAGVVKAFITVHTNILPARHGWGAAGACRRTDLYAASLDTGADGEVSCSFAAPVVVRFPDASNQPPPSPAWQSARAVAAGHGWRLPETWLMAGARVGDHADFVDIRYHFDPQRWGEPAPERGASPWTPAAVAGDPARAQLVGALVHWRLEMAGAVEAGLKNRLENDFALSWPDTASGETGLGRDGRKQALDALLAEGRLSPAQYQEQVRLVAGPGQDASDNAAMLWMIAAKTVGWRIVVAASVALLSYAFTSSAVIAGGITGVTALVNGGLYFGHELLWTEFDPTAAPPPQTIDFAGAGITG